MTKECLHCSAKNPEESEKCQWCGKGFDEPVLEKLVQWDQPQKDLDQRKLISNTLYTIFSKISVAFFLFFASISIYSFLDDKEYSIAVLVLVAYILLYFLAFKLWLNYKNVEIDNTYIYLSNYSIDYPPVLLTEISNITFNNGYDMYFADITIEFKSKTSAGKKISFIPRAPFLTTIYPLPLVRELEKLAGIKSQYDE